MKSPFYLPAELEYVLTCQTPQELLDELNSHGFEDEVAFFEAGVKDVTWARGEGHTFLHRIFENLTEKSFFLALPDTLIKRVALAYRPKFRQLVALLVKDVYFVISGEKIPANSLLFGYASPLIKGMLSQGYQHGKKEFVLENIDLSLFTHILEFVYSGEIKELWKGTDEEIYQLMKGSQKFQINELTIYAASFYKKFIDRENVLPLFKRATLDHLDPLKKQCFDFLNGQQLGFHIELREGLHVTLSSINERGEEFLFPFISKIHSLKCGEDAVNDSKLFSLFAQMKSLQILELSDTHKIADGLIDHLPTVQVLHLGRCSWLDDDHLSAIFSRCKGLETLSLAGNQQLSHKTWGALAKTPSIRELNVLGAEIGDSELDVIAASCPHLTKLNISECVGIGNDGFDSLSQCAALETLIATDLRLPSEAGAIAAFQQMKALRSAHISGGKFITETFVEQLLRTHPSFTHLEVKRVTFKPGFIDEIRKKYPRVEISA